MSDIRDDQLADKSLAKRTDAELAQDCSTGNRAAFGVLVSRHQDRAFNLAFRLTGNRDDAADAVQEAFLKAYRGLPSFRRQSSFYTWLFRILVNEVRSRRRSGSSRRGPRGWRRTTACTCSGLTGGQPRTIPSSRATAA